MSCYKQILVLLMALTTILGQALSLSHHPWPDAWVIMIPKPNEPDYATTKAYHPISLLECSGKLLEKVVANCLSSDAIIHCLRCTTLSVPSFSSCAAFSRPIAVKS